MAGPEEEKPILSLLADDPTERPRIEAFVLALSDCVDGLQDLEQAGQFVRIHAEACGLARQSDGFGFPALSDAATDVAAAAAAKDGKHSREAIVQLTEVARRVRLGHRGAPPPGL